MGLLKNLYYCQECRKLINDISDLLFVELNTVKGFCSEECIEHYYHFIVEHFSTLEKKARVKLNIQDEKCLKFIEKAEYLNETLCVPDQIYLLENKLGEKIYSFYKKFKDAELGEFTFVSYCLTYEYRPSFIFISSATQNTQLLEEFKIGQEIKDINPYSGYNTEQMEVPMPGELTEELEGKKSSLLARLLELRTHKDIPYDRFHLYQNCYSETLESPDEVYKKMEGPKEVIYTYIRGFQKKDQTFYYYVICVDTGPEKKTMETVKPILAFPSLDGEIYREFKAGVLVAGNLKS